MFSKSSSDFEFSHKVHAELHFNTSVGPISWSGYSHDIEEFLRNMKPHEMESFYGGTFRILQLEESLTVYRTGPLGKFWTPTAPFSPWQHALEMAMQEKIYRNSNIRLTPNWHPANQRVLIYQMPPKSIFAIGQAAPQHGWPGMGIQIVTGRCDPAYIHQNLTWDQYKQRLGDLATPKIIFSNPDLTYRRKISRLSEFPVGIYSEARVEQQFNNRSLPFTNFNKVNASFFAKQLFGKVVDPLLMVHDMSERFHQEQLQYPQSSVNGHGFAVLADIGWDMAKFGLVASAMPAAPAIAASLLLNGACSIADKIDAVSPVSMQDNREVFIAAMHGLDLPFHIEMEWLAAFDKGETWTREFTMHAVENLKMAAKPFKWINDGQRAVIGIFRNMGDQLDKQTSNAEQNSVQINLPTRSKPDSQAIPAAGMRQAGFSPLLFHPSLSLLTPSLCTFLSDPTFASHNEQQSPQKNIDSTNNNASKSNNISLLENHIAPDSSEKINKEKPSAPKQPVEIQLSLPSQTTNTNSKKPAPSLWQSFGDIRLDIHPIPGGAYIGGKSINNNFKIDIGVGIELNDRVIADMINQVLGTQHYEHSDKIIIHGEEYKYKIETIGGLFNIYDRKMTLMHVASHDRQTVWFTLNNLSLGHKNNRSILNKQFQRASDPVKRLFTKHQTEFINDLNKALGQNDYAAALGIHAKFFGKYKDLISSDFVQFKQSTLKTIVINQIANSSEEQLRDLHKQALDKNSRFANYASAIEQRHDDLVVLRIVQPFNSLENTLSYEAACKESDRIHDPAKRDNILFLLNDKQERDLERSKLERNERQHGLAVRFENLAHQEDILLRQGLELINDKSSETRFSLLRQLHDDANTQALLQEQEQLKIDCESFLYYPGISDEQRMQVLARQKNIIQNQNTIAFVLAVPKFMENELSKEEHLAILGKDLSLEEIDYVFGANVYRDTNQLQSALELYREAYKLNKNDAYVAINIADIHNKNDELDQAVKFLIEFQKEFEIHFPSVPPQVKIKLARLQTDLTLQLAAPIINVLNAFLLDNLSPDKKWHGKEYFLFGLHAITQLHPHLLPATLRLITCDDPEERNACIVSINRWFNTLCNTNAADELLQAGDVFRSWSRLLTSASQLAMMTPYVSNAIAENSLVYSIAQSIVRPLNATQDLITIYDAVFAERPQFPQAYLLSKILNSYYQRSVYSQHAPETAGELIRMEIVTGVPRWVATWFSANVLLKTVNGFAEAALFLKKFFTSRELAAINFAENTRRLLLKGEIEVARERFKKQPRQTQEASFIEKVYKQKKIGSMVYTIDGKDNTVDITLATHFLTKTILGPQFRQNSIILQNSYINQLKALADQNASVNDVIRSAQLRAGRHESYAMVMQQFGFFNTAEVYLENAAKEKVIVYQRAYANRSLDIRFMDWMKGKLGVGELSVASYNKELKQAQQSVRTQRRLAALGSSGDAKYGFGAYLYEVVRERQQSNIRSEHLLCELQMITVLSHLFAEKLMLIEDSEAEKFDSYQAAQILAHIRINSTSPSMRMLAQFLLTKTILKENGSGVLPDFKFYSQSEAMPTTKNEKLVRQLGGISIFEPSIQSGEISLLEKFMILMSGNHEVEQQLIADLKLQFFTQTEAGLLFKYVQDIKQDIQKNITEIYLSGLLLFYFLIKMYKNHQVHQDVKKYEPDLQDMILRCGYLPDFNKIIIDYFSEKCDLSVAQIHTLLDRYNFNSGMYWSAKKKFSLIANLYNTNQFNGSNLSPAIINKLWGEIVRKSFKTGSDEIDIDRLTLDLYEIITTFDNENDIINAILPKLKECADPNFSSIENRSPLSIAIQKGWQNLINLLIDYGAQANILGPRVTGIPEAQITFKRKRQYLIEEHRLALEQTADAIHTAYDKNTVESLLKYYYPKQANNVLFVEDIIYHFINFAKSNKPISELASYIFFSLLPEQHWCIFYFPNDLSKHKPKLIYSAQKLYFPIELLSELLKKIEIEEYKPSGSISPADSGPWTMNTTALLLSAGGVHVETIPEEDILHIRINKQLPCLKQAEVDKKASEHNEEAPPDLSEETSEASPENPEDINDKQEAENAGQDNQPLENAKEVNPEASEAEEQNDTAIQDPPLIVASKAGDIRNVVELIWKNENIEQKDPIESATSLHWAAINGHFSVVECLVEKKANIDSCHQNAESSGSTPLAWAARMGKKEVVAYLLKHGADPNHEDSLNQNPLHEAKESSDLETIQLIRNQKLILACENNKLDEVKILLDQGANINSQCLKLESEGDTPLIRAIVKGYTSIVDELLRRNANVHSRNKHNHTPLTVAATCGNNELLQRLFSHGAVIDLKGAHQRTALGWAAYHGHRHTVKYLLEQGADTSMQDADEKPALQNAFDAKKQDCVSEIQSKLIQPLMQAVFDNNLSKVLLILKSGISPNNVFAAPAEYSGWTLLFYAIYKKYYDIAEVLLNYGADPNIKISQGSWVGWSPLACLIYKDSATNLQLIKLLLDKHASPSETFLRCPEGVFEYDWSGWSLLNYAAYKMYIIDEYLEIAKMLAYKGAPCNQLLPNGIFGKYSLFEYLIIRGGVGRKLLITLLETGGNPIVGTHFFASVRPILHEHDLYRNEKQDVTNSWLKANFYFHAGNYREAMRIYNEILTIQPHNAYANYFIALSYYHLNDMVNFLKFITTAIDLKKEPKFLILRAKYYFSIKDFERACCDYELIAQFKPDDNICFNNLGCAYNRLNRYKEAADVFSRLIEREPTDAMYYNNRAQVYIELGRFIDAARDFQKAQQYQLSAANLTAIHERGSTWGNIGVHYANALYYQTQKIWTSALEELTKAEQIPEITLRVKNEKIIPLRSKIQSCQQADEERLRLDPSKSAKVEKEKQQHPNASESLRKSSSVADPKKTTLFNPSSPWVAYRTKGEGDCAFHAILGSWDAKQQMYVCPDIGARRSDVKRAISEAKPDSPFYSLIISGIQNLIMNNELKPGTAIHALSQLHKQFEEKKEKEIPRLKEQLITLLHTYPDVITLIAKNHRSPSKDFIHQFLDALYRNDDELRNKIRTIPALEAAFNTYNSRYNQQFDWNSLISRKEIVEYANFVNKLGQYLLPSDLAIIAHVFKKTVIFYSSKEANPDEYNVGQSDIVRVRLEILPFQERGHFERVELITKSHAHEARHSSAAAHPNSFFKHTAANLKVDAQKEPGLGARLG